MGLKIKAARRQRAQKAREGVAAMVHLLAEEFESGRLDELIVDTPGAYLGMSLGELLDLANE